MTGTGVLHQGPPMQWAMRDKPPTWRLSRLKEVGDINVASLPETTEPDFSFTYVDIGSVNADGGVRGAEEITFGAAPSRARRLVRVGDSIVSTVRTYLKAIAYIDDDSANLIVSTGFATLTPRPGVHPRYLYWWLRGSAFVEEIVARSVGVSYPAVNASDVGDVTILLPPIEEQRRIVEVLDAETARIDELIDEQEGLLALLEERYRASLLVLVTRGEDQGAEVVPRSELSGVPVAIGWAVCQLRSLPVEIQTGPFGSQLHQSDYIDDGFPVVNPANLIGGRIRALEGMAVSDAKRSELARHVLRPGDIVFGRRGEMGRAGLVGEEESGWLCGTGSLRIRFNDPVFDSRYLKRFLETSLVKQYLEAASVGATMDNLNAGIVGRVPLVVPPVIEQQKIADAADRLEQQLSALSSEVSRSVGLLREHRQALITAAVTGGMDAVRKVA